MMPTSAAKAKSEAHERGSAVIIRIRSIDRCRVNDDWSWLHIHRCGRSLHVNGSRCDRRCSCDDWSWSIRVGRSWGVNDSWGCSINDGRCGFQCPCDRSADDQTRQNLARGRPSPIGRGLLGTETKNGAGRQDCDQCFHSRFLYFNNFVLFDCRGCFLFNPGVSV